MIVRQKLVGNGRTFQPGLFDSLDTSALTETRFLPEVSSKKIIPELPKELGRDGYHSFFNSILNNKVADTDKETLDQFISELEKMLKDKTTRKIPLGHSRKADATSAVYFYLYKAYSLRHDISKDPLDDKKAKQNKKISEIIHEIFLEKKGTPIKVKLIDLAKATYKPGEELKRTLHSITNSYPDNFLGIAIELSKELTKVAIYVAKQTADKVLLIKE